jgi:hypothetical protein
MELKDVILSTLAEMEGNTPESPREQEKTPSPASAPRPERPAPSALADSASARELLEDEQRYLESVKERLLVLFEGFQSPNNTHIEAKIDLTLNFLEYLLATIDTRIEKIKKTGK